MAILTGTATAAGLGIVAGSLAIRRQGIYFAMITLALAQMMFFFALQAKFTGGEDGIQAVPRGRLFGLIDLSGQFNMAALSDVCGPLGLGIEVQRIWDQPEVRFDPDCVAAVRRAAKLSGFSTRDIVSGAGHDAAYVSRVAPTAMIFVPCRGGISHNEAEFSSKEQCAAGAQVLLQAVLDFDRGLAERRGASR